MCRCYRGAALALGGILMTGLTSLNSCSIGSLTVYAAEDALTEELETAFQEDVLEGEDNVETDIPAEETASLPDSEEESAEEQPPEETGANEVPAEELSAIEEAEETAAEEAAEAMSDQVSGSSFSLGDQEYQVLLRIVEAEAGGEDMTGRMLVANVVMNRVRSGNFPNTVSEVVYQRSGNGAQFSPISDGRINSVSVSQETVDAVARVMNGEDISGGALYFRSVNSRSGWFDRTLNRVLEHGNHIFYTM